MAGNGRDHEPPAVPATVAVVCGAIGFVQGLVVPQQGTVGHVVLGALFGVVGVLAGLRASSIAGRRRGARIWGRTGLVLGALGVAMLAYQTLVIVTGGAVPPPFWSPYGR